MLLHTESMTPCNPKSHGQAVRAIGGNIET